MFGRDNLKMIQSCAGVQLDRLQKGKITGYAETLFPKKT